MDTTDRELLMWKYWGLGQYMATFSASVDIPPNLDRLLQVRHDLRQAIGDDMQPYREFTRQLKQMLEEQPCHKESH